MTKTVVYVLSAGTVAILGRFVSTFVEVIIDGFVEPNPVEAAEVESDVKSRGDVDKNGAGLVPVFPDDEDIVFDWFPEVFTDGVGEVVVIAEIPVLLTEVDCGIGELDTGDIDIAEVDLAEVDEENLAVDGSVGLDR